MTILVLQFHDEASGNEPIPFARYRKA